MSEMQKNFPLSFSLINAFYFSKTSLNSLSYYSIKQVVKPEIQRTQFGES